MKLTKYDCLALRRKLYDTCGSIGDAAEKEPKNEALELTYMKASDALDVLEQYCVKKGYIDSETLEIIDLDEKAKL